MGRRPAASQRKKEDAVFSIGALKSKPDADVERYKEWNAEKDDDAKGFAQKGQAEAELKRVAALPVPRPVKYRAWILKEAAWSLLLFAYLVARPMLGRASVAGGQMADVVRILASGRSGGGDFGMVLGEVRARVLGG